MPESCNNLLSAPLAELVPCLEELGEIPKEKRQSSQRAER